jgi:hypothetical protein
MNIKLNFKKKNLFLHISLTVDIYQQFDVDQLEASSGIFLL